MERVYSGIKHLGGKRKLKEYKVSQTSFGHISINSLMILMVSMATKSPQKIF